MTRSRQTADWGSRAGLAKIVPTSVAVGSGTGSADSLGNVTFSGASSVSLNGCFTSTYDNYKILISSSSSAGGSFNMRLRVSGSDNTSSDYNFQRIYAQSGTVGGVRQNAFSYFEIGYLTTNIYNSYSIEMFSPFETKTTSGNSIVVQNSSSDPNYDSYVYGTDVTTSYTGFTMYPASGTITGTIRVYGYSQ